MNSRTLERVERWESRPFSGGYEGLRDLAGSDFTGAVETAGTWLFMLNGRIVGVHDGTIESFEDASGTAHVAPDPALPLLCTMWEGDPETRAKYYTEDTPISEVDDTLTSGSFTGYLELSENVLSGDYFVVYYGGRSMSAAFVGSRDELLGGDEAFERANDEVGIYEVLDADVEIVEIPVAEPEPTPASEEAVEETSASDDGSDSTAGPAEVSTDEASVEEATTDPVEKEDPAESTTDPAEKEGPSESTTDPAPEAVAADPASETASGAETAESPSQEGETEPNDPPTGARPSRDAEVNDPADGTTDPRADVDVEPDPPSPEDDRTEKEGSARKDDPAVKDDSTEPVPDRHSGEASAVDDTPIAGASTGDAVTAPEQVANDGTSDDDPIESETDWREATVIPSIDPTHTSDPEPGSSSVPSTNPSPRSGEGRNEPTRQPPATEQSATTADSGATDRSRRSTTRAKTAAPDSGQKRVPKSRLDAREERIDELEAELERLEAARDELRSEHEELAAKNESLSGEVDRLEREVSRLRSELETAEKTLEAAGKTAYDTDEQIQASRAIGGTNLFVRYGSKGEATLETAHAGNAAAADVNENLRLERHTTFDADAVAVEGEPYDSFLDGTLEMQFVDWVVRTLPYEIRDTGHESGLRDLYDAIPKIDRVELDGEIELTHREDGQAVTEVAEFDVVLRDRMGEPLIVADLSDSRDPAGERMLVELEADASRVKESSETLAAAFLVTASFFEPGALEATSEATSGSFLSRDSRLSFVKQSRKQGYHLCLVEARGDEFHLNVPEL